MKQTDSGENGSFVYVKDYHPVVGKLLLPQFTMNDVSTKKEIGELHQKEIVSN